MSMNPMGPGPTKAAATFAAIKRGADRYALVIVTLVSVVIGYLLGAN